MRPFYVTTPIYYVNGKPHIGHAYSTVATDVMCRFWKLCGRDARFLTGTDEHGSKIERKAKEEGLQPKAFVDRLIPWFESAWSALGCQYDDFIRTSDLRHERFVQELWKRCEAAGDIYLGEHEGWYAVADEAWYTDKDIEDGKAKETGAKVEWVKEPNYYFRLSKYADRLLEHYEKHPDFVQPEGRFNEVKAFVRGGLSDLSISRPSVRWGVPVPGNPEHTVYVWFDALSNYASALGRPGEPLFDRYWEPGGEVVHVIGKEISRFHSIYWPAFLMSAGLPLPTRIFAHGWMTVNGEKMSKTAGNFLPPEPICDAIGADPFRYYLMREVALGQDGDFSHQNLLARYHGDLGNGVGNLLNRMVTSIVAKSLDGRVPAPGENGELEKVVITTAERASAAARQHFAAFAPHKALEAIWELVAAANKYVDQCEPWKLAKEGGDKARLATVAYTVLESVRWLSILLAPVLPQKSAEMREQLGLPPLMPNAGVDVWPSAWGGLVPGTVTKPGAPLFPRFDEAQQRNYYERLGAPMPAALAAGEKKGADKAKAKGEAKPKGEARPKKAEAKVSETKAAAPEAGDGLITIDDLVKVDLRLGLVVSAERVPKSDKLLELKVDLGEAEPRTILAGIGQHYEPEALVGRRLSVVANLPPRKMMGRLSQGMILAVSDDSGLSVLSPDKDIQPGVRLK